VCHFLLSRCIHLQDKSEPSPEPLLNSIQDLDVVEFSIKKLYHIIGIESCLLPRPWISKEFPRLSLMVVEMCHDLGLQIPVLAPSANDTSNVVNFHAIRRMKTLSICKPDRRFRNFKIEDFACSDVNKVSDAVRSSLSIAITEPGCEIRPPFTTSFSAQFNDAVTDSALGSMTTFFPQGRRSSEKT
jgi:hypothetical protein